MQDYFEFEKPISEIEKKIEELQLTSKNDKGVSEEIKKLEKKAAELRTNIYSNLTPWERTQIARHSQRPTTLDYIEMLTDYFIEIHGDRIFRDDPSIIGGMGKLEDIPVVIIGHQKGKTIREKVFRNFGMPHPEGFRKSLRIMKFAERFKRPIITFIDTPGAYPGIGAEERGQAEAIASSLITMSQLRVPIISIVIGEGGSGGALALGMGDKILMLEHAIYSVISPEGCSAILWSNGSKAPQAAESLKITASELKELGTIDEIIMEPPGGAHRNPDIIAKNICKSLVSHLSKLIEISESELLKNRHEKFRKIGVFGEKNE
ncbi:MAG: acetyl-CoA carboxylase carboxyltransferase subunit alpha [Nitrospirota bacterium]